MFKPIGVMDVQPPTGDRNIMLRATAGLKYSYICISLRKHHSSLCTSSSSSSPTTTIESECLFKTRPDGTLDLSSLPGSLDSVPSRKLIRDVETSGNNEKDLPFDDGELRGRQVFSLLAGRYKVVKLLGEGAFAQTLLAVDMYHPSRPEVAIKIMNNNYNIIGAEEYKRLIELNFDDSQGNLHIVRLITSFAYNSSHFCLVFERLYGRQLFVHDQLSSPNPRHLALLLPSAAQSAEERRRREAYGVARIRKLALQLMLSLMLLKDHNLIHADLKPENILFNDDSSFSIKLIDFGNAFTLDQVHVYFDTFEVQTLIYRAPEVLVGLPFGCEIDMWSVGMILCESWLGRPFIRASNREQMLQLITEFLGPLPKVPHANGKFYNVKYSNVKRTDSFRLDLSSPQDLLKFRIRKLSEALGTRDLHFLYFLNSMLEFDPNKRLTPTDALAHPFLSSLFPFDRIQKYVRLQTKQINGGLASCSILSGTPIPIISPHPLLKKLHQQDHRTVPSTNTTTTIADDSKAKLDDQKSRKRDICNDENVESTLRSPKVHKKSSAIIRGNSTG